MATTPSSTAGGNTPTNAQWSAGTRIKYKMKIPGLQPGLTYNLVVRAENSTGRSDYAVKTYSVPLSDASGSNGVVYNKGQDIRLQGGSIFATTSDSNALPKDLGQINILGTAPTGRGLIINQTGIGAFRDGVAQFRLSAIEGTAEFAGKVSAGEVKIGPDIDPTGTKNGIYINSGNYWYDDGTFKTTAENVTRIVTGADALKPGAPTNLTGTWEGQDFRLSFNFNTTTKTELIDNTHVQAFVITHKLVDGNFKVIKVAVAGTNSQDYLLTKQANEGLFGVPQTSFAQIVVVAEDIYGKQGPPAILNNTATYINPIPVPTISVTNSNNGYSVNFTNYPNPITYPSFSRVVVEEYVSASNIDPGPAAYLEVYRDTVNPAIVITPTTAQRWVRARYLDSFGILSLPSAAYKANPVNPVAANLDLLPPNDVQVGTVAWNGNNIEISYALPATDPGERFVVALTTNYAPYDDPALTGFFYKYPDPSGKVIITQDELFGQFGGYYTGYSGLFKSADAADNRTAGVSFTVPVKQSAISSLTPDLNLINVFGVPNGYVVQPYLVSGASSMEIYESTTSTGPWTLKANTSQLYAATVSTYSTKYLRFRWTGAFGDFSLFTLAKAANPIDPTAFSTIPPDTPSVGVTTTNKTSLVLGIDTLDTVKTKGYFLKYFPTTEPTDITTETIPSNGVGTISYTLKNLAPGTSYTVSVAGYNDSNIVGNYSTPQAFATTTATVSVPTSVALTGASYGALATWVAPSSPETTISRYGVSVYNAAGVLFTEQDTSGTTFSVSGLKASTSYYVRVVSKDIYGNSSAFVQSNTITLNAVGGTNDGSAVATSPTPTITPLFGALQVKWDAVTNVDSVTYEVHISTSTGFTPDRPLSGTSTTRVIQTEGTFAIIKTLPSGVSLNYDTLYYVRIVAKDFDGAAGPSTQASGTPSKVDNGDIAANAVRANQIFAGSVSADKVDSTNLLVSKLFSVGSGGTFAIKIDATGDGTTTPYKLYSGFGSYYDAGTAFYLDSLGKFSLKDKLFFDGTTLNVNGAIVAQSGYFNGPITVNGFNPAVAMKIGRNVSGSLDGISLDANNYWYTNGSFRVGSSTLGFSWDGISSFKVTGNIEAREGKFLGAVTIDDVQANAGLWVLGTNATYTAGPRVVINKNGLYAYNFGATTGQAASTYINLAASSGAYTFVTENAQIGGWTVDSNKIEKLTAGLYSGMATGSVSTAIAFYAGSTGSGGNNTAKFSVTQGGAVIARDISIIGDGTTNTILQIGGTGNASPFTVDAAGNMKSTSATITGAINAASGNFTGNVFIGTAGSLVSGTVTLPSTPQAPTSNTNTYPILSSSGYILNKAGITFSNGLSGGSLRETTIAASSGLLTTNSANIGGWDITPGKISKSGIELNTAIVTGVPAITTVGTIAGLSYYVGITPPTSTTTDAVIWAGNRDYAGRNTANFRVDSTGKLYATGASITGEVVISSGATYTALNKAQTDATSAGTDAAAASNAASLASAAAEAAKIKADSAKALADTSLQAGGNAVKNASNQITTINASGIKITSSGFSLNGSGTATTASSSSLVMNANGITATDSSGVTRFVISADGSAQFSGALSAASGSFNGTLSSASNITSGGTLTGSDLDIGGDLDTYRFKTSYNRTNTVSGGSVSSLGINSIAMVSQSTSGVISSWYPYYSGSSDLGTNSYRWRRLLVDKGDYGTDAGSYVDVGVGKIRLYGTGEINANYLGTTTTIPGSGNNVIQSGGFLRVYVSASSRKYKDNIVYKDTSNLYNLFKSMRPVTFNYNKSFSEETEAVHLGFIAEDVHDIEPNNDLMIYKDGEPESLAYEKIPVLLVGAFKEMANRIDSLQAQLDNLKK